ncbi:hypothetical protein GON26_14035 [Flavobacterium sp. GA093]|uniref:Uncharacterized protein n=1 Tax=Flavobacterium hydrocarbonoxydans TaxID=2683249 RepID=A0A6I4NSL5_9FLAO|nr:hypothetical protein [Flavobacterium hydrocarbonoxydans]MWB95485.1 hypothetical protein [Flavobacterium hydrocarbonoxydans]
MEKQNNTEYGQTDPDIIDQNTLVDGNDIQSEEYTPQNLNNENKTEFGETDPDYIDQNTIVNPDNYARDENPYQYQEEFIEDLKHPKSDSATTKTVKPENIQNQENKIEKTEVIPNNEEENNSKVDKE